MFFSWYLKNKHFKQGSNLRGQIAPFLLVTLVILLIAAITTINIGRIGIDKTYSANAADSGALAGASIMAGVMNGLCETNQAFLDAYVGFYYSYLATLILAEEHWENAWIAMATVSALQLVAAVIAYFWSLNGEASCTAAAFIASWQYFVVVGFLIACTVLVHYAMNELAKLATDISILKSTITDFHDASWEAYCDLLDSLALSMSEGELSAKKMAFGNSGISEKLNTSQGDAFSAFLSGSGGGSYSWTDKVSQTHTVTVDVNMPTSMTFNIQHTVLSYSEEIAILDQIISDINDVNQTLYGMAISIDTATVSFILIAIGALVVWALYLCSQTVIGCIVCCGPWLAACGIWLAAAGIAAGYLSVIGIILDLIMLVSGLLGSATLYGIMDGLEESFAGLDPDGSLSSTSCGDAADLLIVMFSSVTYPGDVSAQSTQNHPSVSSGLVPTTYQPVTSYATANYEGGDVGSMDASYDSRLSSAN